MMILCWVKFMMCFKNMVLLRSYLCFSYFALPPSLNSEYWLEETRNLLTYNSSNTLFCVLYFQRAHSTGRPNPWEAIFLWSAELSHFSLDLRPTNSNDGMHVIQNELPREVTDIHWIHFSVCLCVVCAGIIFGLWFFIMLYN